MKRFIRGCLCVLIGGLGIYIAEFFCSTDVYIKRPDRLSALWVVTSIVVGGLISIFVILYKSTSSLEMIFRFITMGISYFCIMLLNTQIGAISFLYNLFGINTYSLQDNVSGMMTTLFLFVIMCTSIVTIILASIIRLCKKRREKNQNNTEDSSLH